ncbi:CRISPR-associated RAMP protein [Metallosphaera tengchongensis]|uniref:CRISPR-associated RAMP protein n=1 Tax=Metallosphaera tengchongensis TaxID=1532350 RepID=A0A6N0NV82_9CREN|nr:CRISPR-associated RAMP protein Csx7 [Metallosphaera tengchongensis]QKR00774.1 CRISPR-associated RAMP protein [Metallosphaera tengchongensis]
MSCYDLDKITSIIKVEGKLVNKTPLRVGSGKEASLEDATDNPIMKVDGRPVIPGSSIKGAFRSFIEAYERAKGDQKSRVCDIDDDEESCTSCDDTSYCVPCILFGFKDLGSRVFILDAVAKDFRVGQRTMVSINRVFGGQAPGHLYTLDYVEPEAAFDFTMVVYNLDLVNNESEEWKKESVEAMRLLLKYLSTDGIFLGARRSVGFGLVKLTEANVSLYKAPDLFTAKKYSLQDLITAWSKG